MLFAPFLVLIHARHRLTRNQFVPYFFLVFFLPLHQRYFGYSANQEEKHQEAFISEEV
jgi:hypothetical protein